MLETYSDAIISNGSWSSIVSWSMCPHKISGIPGGGGADGVNFSSRLVVSENASTLSVYILELHLMFTVYHYLPSHLDMHMHWKKIQLVLFWLKTYFSFKHYPSGVLSIKLLWLYRWSSILASKSLLAWILRNMLSKFASYSGSPRRIDSTPL